MFTGLLRIDISTAQYQASPPAVFQGKVPRHELLDDFAKEGCGIYRTNIDLIARVAKRCGPVKGKVKRRIKRALDPNGIHALGKIVIHG